MPPAISVANLGKSYRVGRAAPRGYRTLRESLVHAAQAPLRRLRGRNESARDEEFWALKDVEFEVQPGEVVGIIGRNGAGKSTLLKVLSRITSPTRGRVAIQGRMGSLLEVGTGFHPELTGRENVYLNGAILGIRRDEISRKFDRIVSFAGIDTFLDTPVKRYSSGMFMRLAFAVAAHLDTEILLVDEVLAVGDAAFQKKCLDKMSTVAVEGRTILFVSHNIAAVRALCGRCVHLERGRVVAQGPTEEMINAYIKSLNQLRHQPIAERADRKGRGQYRFSGLRVLDRDWQPCSQIATGDDLTFEVTITRQTGRNDETVLDLGIIIKDDRRNVLTTLASHFTGQSPCRLGAGQTVVCRVPRFPLLEGRYYLDLWCGTSMETQDALEEAAVLDVGSGDYFRNRGDARLPASARHGFFLVPQYWSSDSCSGGCHAIE
jgi:lipopolysaccharide transport system ATP-binding protein